MKVNFKKTKMALILIISIVMFGACSNSGDKDENENLADNQTTENDKEPENELTTNDDSENSMNQEENDTDEEDSVPDSEFQISKMQINDSFFFSSSMDISSSFDKEVMDIFTEFNAVNTDEGAMLTLPEDILFDFDEEQLRPDADEAIEKLVKIADETDGDITIVGHTDSHGEDDYNQKLSEDRSEAVLEALVDSDVDSERLESEGKGDTEPVADNENSDGSDNSDGRQKNRRVEVTIHDFEQ